MQLELPTAHLNNRFSSEDCIQVIIQYKTNSKVKARHQQKRLQKLPIQHAFSFHEKPKKKKHTDETQFSLMHILCRDVMKNRATFPLGSRNNSAERFPLNK